MKILVTGGTGFIGGFLVEKLVQQNHDVVCMVRKTSDTSRLDKLGVEQRIGDLGEPSSLTNITKDVDVCYHLAAYYTFMGKKSLYKKINVEGTKALLEACNNAGVGRFIYCSSTEAIGAVTPTDNPEEYATEDAPYNPQYEYGKSKMEAEQIVKNFNKDIEWTIIRPSGVYGPRCVEDISYYFVQALAKHKMSMWFRVRNSGTVHFTHVQDIVQGFDLARSPKAKNEVFFIAADLALRVDDAINQICEVLGRKPPRFALPAIVSKFMVAPVQLLLWLVRKKDFFLQVSAVNSIIQGRNYSNKKAKELLNFQPKYDFLTGMKETVEWYRENGYL